MSAPSKTANDDETNHEGDTATPAASTEAPPLTDWTLRLFEATSQPPWIVGLGIAACVSALSMVFRVFGDENGYGLGNAFLDPFFWIDTLNALIIGYVAAAHAMQRRGVLRDLDRLRSVLSGSSARHRERVRELLCVKPRSLLFAGVVGGCALGLLPAIDESYWLGNRPNFADPTMLFLILRNFVTGFVAGHAVRTEIHVTRAYGRLGESELDVDLLDLAPLSAFARKGQRGAISWLVASSLVSLFWLGPTATNSNAFIVLIILGLVTLVFFHPIYGAHRGIRHAKQVELGSLRDELRTLQAAEREAPGDAARNARIAAAAALHVTIENVREWPVDAPALLRFGLFALLGLASWFGSAIVERLLDTAIG